MFDNFWVRALTAEGNRKLLDRVFPLIGIFLFPLFVSGCAHISLQPKDPQLIALEQFARDVSVHLMSADPKTYEQCQHALAREIVPGVLKQLKERGACAKSQAEIKSRVQAMTKANQACMVKIESADFPSKVTEAGLVPVEVKGSVITIVGNQKEKPTKFDLLFLIGTNKKDPKKLVVASIQIK